MTEDDIETVIAGFARCRRSLSRIKGIPLRKEVPSFRSRRFVTAPSFDSFVTVWIASIIRIVIDIHRSERFR